MITTEVPIIDLLAVIVTIIISIVGGTYAVVTNTKKFEIKENYRKELLEWYSTTNKILIRIIHSIDKDEFYRDEFLNERISLISELSFYIELGRFYFPNILKNDGFGDNKPSAYIGYRHIALEFLMTFYDKVSSNTRINNTYSLWKMERYFTSFVFDAINPRSRIKDYSQYSKLKLPPNMAIEDFLDENSDNISVFW